MYKDSVPERCGHVRTEILKQGVEREFLLDTDIEVPHGGGGFWAGVAVGSPVSPASGASGCADLPEAYPKIKIHHRTRSPSCLLRSACALVCQGVTLP